MVQPSASSFSLFPSARTADHPAAALRPWVRQAKEKGCHLILFPLLPLTADGLLLAAASALAREAGLLLGFAATAKYSDVQIPPTEAVVPREAVPFAEAAFRAEAIQSAVTLSARGAYLFGPDGALVGHQAQTQMPPEDRAAGLHPGRALEPIPLPPPAPAGLKAGFLVGLDAWYPEVARILTLKGASLLLAPLAMPAPYNPWHQVAAMWQQVQQNQVFGLEACLVGLATTARPGAGGEGTFGGDTTGGGKTFAGRSAVFAPCEMTPGETGILAQMGVDPARIDPGSWADGISDAGSDQSGLVVADLDFSALQRTVDSYSLWEQQNLDFYRSFFPSVYDDSPSPPVRPGNRTGSDPGDGGEPR